ncbi:2-nitropropane dioxygenase [Apiospora hydei]|uniref:2-nitropropane dioxygenase n=1 Tax=Apiospora hydei TaxID=1337664 RepID=A0ABR1V8G2_9PEZI
MASSTAPPRTRMQRWFPTTASPLIVSAPMDFVTNATLASEASSKVAATLPPGGAALTKLDKELGLARRLLSGVGSSNGNATTAGQDGQTKDTLPLGVGFVAYAPSVSHFAETAVPILASYRPAAVWLFAPAPDQPGTIGDMIRALRSSSSSSSPGGWNSQVKVAVQVGSVAAAREAVEFGADIVVAQGVDAGGHQWARGAGVVSLVPEIADMVSSASKSREVAVWAAGGLAEGRGVAASLVLGAEAAVLGTKFMVATESDTQDFKRKAILSTSDGGMNTVKSQLHDHIQGNMTWPDIYDGRAVVHPCYHDHVAGVPLEENAAKFKTAKEAGDNSMMVTWSGTGVGLIKESLPAGEMVKQLREAATQALQVKPVL